MTDVRQTSKAETRKSPIRVQLKETNYFTRWPCHSCGGCTEKVSILAEVFEGEYAGFRVCETCLYKGGIADKIQAHAEQHRVQADELLALVDRLEVPTWREYLLAEIKSDAELAKAHLGTSSLATEAAEWLERIHRDYYSALTQDDVLGAFGVTLAEAEEAKRRLDEKRREQGAAVWDDLPF